MFPINGKFFIESTEMPDKPLFLVNQGSTWRTFTQYGDAEAYAKCKNLELNSVTILEVKPVLVLEEAVAVAVAVYGGKAHAKETQDRYRL